MRLALGLLVATVALAGVARAQDGPDIESRVIGTFTMSGRDGNKPLTGKATIAPVGSELRFTTEIKPGLSGTAVLTSGGTSWKFALVSGGGLAGAISGVTSANTTRFLELTVGKDENLTGVITNNGEQVGKIALTRSRAVLIIHANAYDATHASAFHGYATRVAKYYKNKGFTKAELVLGTGWETAIAALNSAQSFGHPYERLVIIGHGGWDGPILSKGQTTQASSVYNVETFEKVVSALRRGTTENAKYVFSACHAGGSDRYEKKNTWNNNYLYTDAVAQRTGRMAVGPAGKTSTEYTEQLVRAVEGEDVTKQETRVAKGNAGMSVMPKQRITEPKPTPEPAVPTNTVANLPLGEPGN